MRTQLSLVNHDYQQHTRSQICFLSLFLMLVDSQCSHADVNVGNPKSGDVLNSSSLLVYFKEKKLHFVVYISNKVKLPIKSWIMYIATFKCVYLIIH